VSGDDKQRKKTPLFYERQQQELNLSKNRFFLPTSNLHQKAWGKNFLLLVIIHIANVPDLCKSLGGRIAIKNVHENMTVLHT
jgi:hypothetical protein